MKIDELQDLPAIQRDLPDDKEPPAPSNFDNLNLPANTRLVNVKRIKTTHKRWNWAPNKQYLRWSTDLCSVGDFSGHILMIDNMQIFVMNEFILSDSIWHELFEYLINIL